jgi:hypothetical protein
MVLQVHRHVGHNRKEWPDRPSRSNFAVAVSKTRCTARHHRQMGRRFVAVGLAGGACDVRFAGGWCSELVMTLKTPKMPLTRRRLDSVVEILEILEDQTASHAMTRRLRCCYRHRHHQLNVQRQNVGGVGGCLQRQGGSPDRRPRSLGSPLDRLG